MKKILLTAILCTTSIFSQEVGQSSVSVYQLASGNFNDSSIKQNTIKFLDNFIATNIKSVPGVVRLFLSQARDLIAVQSDSLYRDGMSPLEIPVKFYGLSRLMNSKINQNDLLKLTAILIGSGIYALDNNIYAQNPEIASRIAEETTQLFSTFPNDENLRALKEQIINLGYKAHGPKFIVEFNANK